MDALVGMVKAGKTKTKAAKPAKGAKKVSKDIKRRKNPELTAIERMTDSNFVRHKKLAGILRIRDRKKVYSRLKNITRDILASVIRPSVHLMQYSRKRTLMPRTVLHVANATGRTIYWTDEDEHVQVGSHIQKASAKKKKKLQSEEI